MTDQELLELAAKAVGAEWLSGSAERWVVLRDDGVWHSWDPLEDDGDALRLAGRLELDVMHRVVGGKRVEVLAAGAPLIQEFYEGEPYAAARRAIVRAAAEIARKRATKETANGQG
jgi:hypothetical protein